MTRDPRTREPGDRNGDPPDSSPPRPDGGSADDIPLDIAGHDEKRRRSGEETNGTGGSALSEFEVAEPDETDGEIEPVELLVQLAEDGEIDPWDIDVVKVTEEFLERLDAADLRAGGRALFYASVLLRMKSDALLADEDEPQDEPLEDPYEAAPIQADTRGDPFAELEAEMDRRIERKRARGMPQTLDELVRELRERERKTWWKSSRSYDTSDSPGGYSRGTQTLDYRTGDDFRMDDEPTVDDVTGTAHGEQMEATINDVYVELQRHYDGGRTEVLFAEIDSAGDSTIDTFLGLLFLAHRGQVRLRQDDFFGDLWIGDPAAVVDGEPAPADD